MLKAKNCFEIKVSDNNYKIIFSEKFKRIRKSAIENLKDLTKSYKKYKHIVYELRETTPNCFSDSTFQNCLTIYTGLKARRKTEENFLKEVKKMSSFGLSQANSLLKLSIATCEKNNCKHTEAIIKEYKRRITNQF